MSTLRIPITAVLVLAGALCASRADAQEGEIKADRLRVQLVAATESVVPGKPVSIGIRFQIDPDWHIYWKNPGDSGEPPSVRWSLPGGITAGPIRWPVPIRVFTAHLASYAYEGEIVLPVTLRAPKTLARSPVTIRADVSWLVCKEDCIPGDATLSLTLPVNETVTPSTHASLFEAAARLQPRQAPARSVTARRQADRHDLEISGDSEWMQEVARAPSVLFMPDVGDAVIAAAPQALEMTGDRLTLRCPRAEDAPDVDRLAGLLVVGNDDGRRGYRIDAPFTVTPTGATPAPIRAPTTAYESFGGERPTTLWTALLLALLGGLLLNLMPCVLPVLSLKVLGFVGQAQDAPERIRRHGYVFGLGVLAAFWALAGLLLVLQAQGNNLGWGFQLQEPAVVAGMAFLMLAMGMNLVGAFEIGEGLAGAAGRASDRVHGTGYRASFANGILATVIATPCTAPFMVGAMSYAVGKPPLDVMAVFTALGVGMAAPYVVLAVFPQWLSRVPRPGPWMVTFRQAMSFPLFGTALWLVWIFTKQTGTDGLAWLLAGMTLVALGLWLFGRTARRSRIGVAIALCLLVGGVVVGLQQADYASSTAQAASTTSPDDGIAWIPFSEERIASLRAGGRPVFVDFTADWCIVCKANEAAFIESEAMRSAARKHDLAFVKADWTRRDARITEALRRFDRNSVPVYVFYSPDLGRAPVVLNNTAITSSTLIRALEHVVADPK